MEITSKIVKQGEAVGVRLQDGAVSYPIVFDALATREIFKSLTASGWTLVGIPFKFSKQGVSSENLQEEDFEKLPINERADFFTYDNSDMLSDDELVQSMPKNKEHIPWRPPIYAHITTRTQFLEFLKESRNMHFSSSIPESYCPLNSFCLPEAMFTPEEYFDSQNMEYINIIENRHILKFEAYQELVALFVSLGMPKSYTAYDFQQFYFSWGVCGMNTQLIKQEKETNVMPLGVAYASNSTSYPKTRISQDLFLDSEGKILPELAAGWRLPDGQSSTALETDEIVRVTAFKEVVDCVTVLICDDLRVKFNDYRLRYWLSGSGQEKWLSAVQVRYPLSYNYIPVQHFNILTDEGKRHIYNQLITNALSHDLVRSLKVSSDASSLKALKAVGFTERAGISYIAHRLAKLTVTSGSEDGAAVDNEEAKKLKAIIAGLTDYLGGEDDIDRDALRPADDIFDVADAPSITCVEDFVSDTRSGQINIDAILEGQNSDAAASRDLYSSIFAALLNNNLISADSLIQQVSNFSLGSEDAGLMRIITDTNQFIMVPVSKGTMQMKSYIYDVKNYLERIADAALAWIHVNKIYSEPTTGDRARHVAVEIYRFDHATIGMRGLSLANSGIIMPLSDIVEELIANLPDAASRRKAEQQLNMHVAHAIFTAYTTDSTEIKTSESLGKQVLHISQGILDKIRKAVYKQYDSTFAICDHMDFGGEFGYYCYNATIYPELVVPNKGSLLFVYPFLENWENLRANPALTENYRQRCFIPSYDDDPDFIGICNYYRKAHAVDHADCDVVADLRASGVYMRADDATQYSPWSLKVYADRVQKEIAARREQKNKQLTFLPMLHEDCFPLSYPAPEPEYCSPDSFISDITAPAIYPVVASSILSKWPEIKELRAVNSIDAAEDKNIGLKDVAALSSDVFTASNSEGLVDLPHRLSEKPVKLALRFGDALMFTDKTKMLCKDLTSLDKSIYAYEQVGSYLFLMDNDGSIYIKKLSEGVVS